jgi:indolepyruvate ferredoxin oxidoreductase
VLNSDVLPTGEMVRNVWADFDASAATASIAAYARPGQTTAVPARAIAEALFGDYVFTNMVTLGTAVQAGRVPVSPASIETAIALGKVAAEDNIQAFRYGRLWAADPGRMKPLLDGEPDPKRAWDDAVAALTPRSRSAYERIWALARGLDDSSSEMLGLRVADLVDYQNPAYAGTYLSFVLEVAEREEAVCPGQRPFTRAVIKNLHKLMAYKDEYEVARLHLKAGWRDELARTFEAPVRVSYRLHPPLLRSLGLRRKLELGPWFSQVLAVLRRLRALRGTRLDPFGYAAVRREERALISWYREVTTDALAHLTPRNYTTATEIAELPERIRGYEDLKLRASVQARERAAALIDEMQRPRLPVTIVPQRGSA